MSLHANIRKLIVKDSCGKDVALYLSTEVKGTIHLRTDRKDYYIKSSELTDVLYELLTGKKWVRGKHAKGEPYAEQ